MQLSKLGFDTSQSACKGVDVRVFFPEREPREKITYRIALKQATDICNECAVKQPCLDYALNNETMGIWGGTTELERHMMRQKMDVKLPENRLISDTLANQLRSFRPRGPRRK